jgi:hypothetical protein
MRRITLLLGALYTLAWVTTVSASVTVTYSNFMPGYYTPLNLKGSGTLTTTNGGSFTATTISQDGPDAGVPVPTHVFCIEIPEGMSVDINYTYGDLAHAGLVPLADAPKKNGANPTVTTPMGAAAASLIAGLWHNEIATVDAALALPYNYTNEETIRATVGAFQLAIWKLEYDGQNGPAGLSFTDSNQNLTVTGVDWRGNHTEEYLAQTWINALVSQWDANAKLYVGPKANLVALSDVHQQDLVGEVPEPLSVVVWTVLGAGAGGMALRRRRGATRWSTENRQAIMGMIESKLRS